jgi:glyoxylase-like metal-dependent hydrolase (beta-lactamase superfamily II)
VGLLAAAGDTRAQERFGPDLTIWQGAVNGAIFERHGKHLAVYGDPAGHSTNLDWVLLTHARRDVTWAAEGPARAGALIAAPAREIDALAQPDAFWRAWTGKRFHDYAQASSRLPVRALPVTRQLKGGDRFEWEDLTFRVLDTPGYTRGAVSYLVETGGRKVAFTGDVIRDDGKLQDLFSLQDAIPDAKIGGYHGWAGRLGDLVASLHRLADENPDLIVPVRGRPIASPQAALGLLEARIRRVYTNYLAIDALRWYFKDQHILAKARRVLGPEATVDWMPMAETRPLPDWIRTFSNSRLILATDGAGFLVDCGSPGIIDELRKLRAAGTLKSLEHVFVTHYHDDHTDALPALVHEFGARVHACGSLVDVLEHPSDYRLPCLTKNPVPVTARHADRDAWRWREFALTVFDFPGQTLHHNALLVQRNGGGAYLFAGDSFTPSGIDDYCLQNRNFLAPGHGYFKCLDILDSLSDALWLINQHVEPAFRFTASQRAAMRTTLERRIPLLADLLPFDAPDFGLDEGWATLHPYAVTLRPGEETRLALRLTNHAPGERRFRTVVHAPKGWDVRAADSVRLAPMGVGEIEVRLRAVPGASAGLHIITADAIWDDGNLREWCEAMIEIVP